MPGGHFVDKTFFCSRFQLSGPYPKRVEKGLVKKLFKNTLQIKRVLQMMYLVD